MFKNKKFEVKIVDDKKDEEFYYPPKTRPTESEIEAAKQVLVGGAVLFFAKLIVDATTEIVVASIQAK